MWLGWPEYWRAWWNIWRKGWIPFLLGGRKISLCQVYHWDCNAICHCWKPFIWLIKLQGQLTGDKFRVCHVQLNISFLVLVWIVRRTLGESPLIQVSQMSYVNHDRHLMVSFTAYCQYDNQFWIHYFPFDCQVFSTLLKVTSVTIGNHHYSKTILVLTFLL